MSAINNIIDYNSLYSAYTRLLNEGDKTSSAHNASNVLGQDVDIDKDGTAELWELMEAANTANKKIIFDSIDSYKKVQNNKYPEISEDNPINQILSVERKVTGDKKTDNAYQIINEIIRTAKRNIKCSLSPEMKMEALYKIIHNKFHVQYEETLLLSEGLSKDTRKIDCDTGSFIYLSVAHELNWPLYIINTISPGHAFVYWKENENVRICHETTSGKPSAERFVFVVNKRSKYYEENQKNIISAMSYFNIGHAYSDRDDNELSLANYSRAIELDSSMAIAYGNRAAEYAKSGNMECALEDLCEGAKLEPDMVAFNYEQAKLYSKNHDYEHAIQCYYKILNLYPDSTSAHVLCANEYIRSANYKSAISEYSKAIEKDGNYADAYYLRGKAFIDMGFSEKGLADIKRSNELLCAGNNFNVDYDLSGIDGNQINKTIKKYPTIDPGLTVRLMSDYGEEASILLNMLQ